MCNPFARKLKRARKDAHVTVEPMNRMTLPLDVFPMGADQGTDQEPSQEPNPKKEHTTQEQNSKRVLEGMDDGDLEIQDGDTTAQKAKKIFLRTVIRSLKYVLAHGVDIVELPYSFAVSIESDPQNTALIRKHIAAHCGVIVSALVTYNWYYMMFYKPSARPNVSMEYIHDHYPLVHLTMKYLLYATAIIDDSMMSSIPWWTHKFTALAPERMRPLLCYAVAVFVAMFMTHGFLSDTVRAMYSALENRVDDDLRSLHLTGMLYLGMIAPLVTTNPIHIAKTLIQWVTMGIPTFIIFILRLTLFSIPFISVSVFLKSAYVLFISFAAIPFSELNLLPTIDKMRSELFGKDAPLLPVEEDDPALPSPPLFEFWLFRAVTESTFRRFLRRAAAFSKFTLKYVFEITLLFSLMFACFDYGFNWNTKTGSLASQLATEGLTMVMVLALASWLYFTCKTEFTAVFDSSVHIRH